MKRKWLIWICRVFTLVWRIWSLVQHRILLYDPPLISTKDHSGFQSKRVRRRCWGPFMWLGLCNSKCVDEVVFCECWRTKRFNDSSIYTPLKEGLHIERSWTRNPTRNLCHVWGSSSVLWKFRVDCHIWKEWRGHCFGTVEKFLSHHDRYSVDRKYTVRCRQNK